jgi:hypothetical protein
VRWNLRFPRHLLETTHTWFIVISNISKNIAPPFVHKFPFLIVYKKLRILRIGTHYGLSVWCVYTLAKSENKQFSKLSYQFFWQLYQMAVNRPNDHKIRQHLPLQDPPKYTQIRIFGLKTNHLATLRHYPRASGMNKLALLVRILRARTARRGFSAKN